VEALRKIAGAWMQQNFSRLLHPQVLLLRISCDSIYTQNAITQYPCGFSSISALKSA
jgi:hypothetical protein